MIWLCDRRTYIHTGSGSLTSYPTRKHYLWFYRLIKGDLIKLDYVFILLCGHYSIRYIWYFLGKSMSPAQVRAWNSWISKSGSKKSWINIKVFNIRTPLNLVFPPFYASSVAHQKYKVMLFSPPLIFFQEFLLSLNMLNIKWVVSWKWNRQLKGVSKNGDIWNY